MRVGSRDTKDITHLLPRVRPVFHEDRPTFPPTNEGGGPTVREGSRPNGESNLAGALAVRVVVRLSFFAGRPRLPPAAITSRRDDGACASS